MCICKFTTGLDFLFCLNYYFKFMWSQNLNDSFSSGGCDSFCRAMLCISVAYAVM